MVHGYMWVPLQKISRKKIVTFGEMVIFASPILLPSMWPTFPTMPKLVDLIITTSPINKFAFHTSWNGSKFRPS
jgi:hypothetical protein